MDKKKKLTLIGVGIAEVIILVFCLVVSIMVMTTIDKNGIAANNIKNNGAFIGGLQNNSVLFFCAIVLPLFIIFIVDGVYLIMYATKKQSMLSDKEKESIQEEARRQAREEVLKEMKKPSTPDAADPKDEK